LLSPASITKKIPVYQKEFTKKKNGIIKSVAAKPCHAVVNKYACNKKSLSVGVVS